MQAIKTIKTLVLFMGVLLIAGLAVLGYGLYSKAGSSGKSQSRPVFTSQDFSTALPVPAGAKFEQMVVAGDRVVLRFSGAAGDRLLVLDAHEGRMVGSFSLSPEAPASGK